jgi:hypothetical protein
MEPFWNLVCYPFLYPDTLLGQVFPNLDGRGFSLVRSGRIPEQG